MYLGPNITATNPEVGGTVESHKSPIALANIKIETGEIGNRINNNITIERVK